MKDPRPEEGAPACADEAVDFHLSRALPLTVGAIDGAVARTAPGTFALGYLEDGVFVAFYVGRADSDLNGGLHDWLGVDGQPGRYAPGPRAAYGSRARSGAPFGAPCPRAVGVAVDGRYTHFEYRYAASARAAYQEQCRHYHELGGPFALENASHPAPPRESGWPCPVLDSHPG